MNTHPQPHTVFTRHQQLRSNASQARTGSRSGRCSGRPRIAPAPQTGTALPRVWAVGEPVRRLRSLCVHTRSDRPVTPEPAPERDVVVYRPYTEALLRRYVSMSMEAGRAPSLLGRELFRSQVSHSRVEGFDDVVIFCHDVERAVKTLSIADGILLRRIGMQEYTQGEAAALLGLSLRTVVRGYALALDRLTRTMLEWGLLKELPTRKALEMPPVENVVKGVEVPVLA